MRAFENGGCDSFAFFEPVGPEVSAPTRASGRGPWLLVSIAPVPGSLPWRLGFRPLQATLERTNALTSTNLTLSKASPRTPAPHRRGGAFVRSNEAASESTIENPVNPENPVILSTLL